MIGQIYNIFVAALVFASPAFVLPAILGPVILRLYRGDELSKLAGVFTLKPLLATLLWAFIYSLGITLDLPEGAVQILLLIPGIGLTMLIVLAFKRLFRSETRIALVLLVVDALRWLNTFAWVRSRDVLESPLYMVALILPNAYAIMALAILWFRARRYEPQVGGTLVE